MFPVVPFICDCPNTYRTYAPAAREDSRWSAFLPAGAAADSGAPGPKSEGPLQPAGVRVSPCAYRSSLPRRPAPFLRPLTVHSATHHTKHSSRTMHPRAQIAPKKIGVQGPSKTKKVSSSKKFTTEELRELRRLATVLPPVSRPSEVDSEETLRKAAAYIQQLVATVHARVANGTLSPEVLTTLPPQHCLPPRRLAPKPSIEKKR